jgi:hypothetical protein
MRIPIQLSLFRKTDPETSREAAFSFTEESLSEIQTYVLGIIKSFGSSGCIQDDVLEKSKHKYNTTTARFVELEREGHIKRPGPKKKAND